MNVLLCAHVCSTFVHLKEGAFRKIAIRVNMRQRERERERESTKSALREVAIIVHCVYDVV